MNDRSMPNWLFFIILVLIILIVFACIGCGLYFVCKAIMQGEELNLILLIKKMCSSCY